MPVSVFLSGDFAKSRPSENIFDDSIKMVVRSADFSICNFEAPILGSEAQKIPKVGPHLGQHVSAISSLVECGFTHVCLANNHVMDYGGGALNETIRRIEASGLGFIGAGSDFESAYKVKYLESGSIKIALLAACENEFGCLDSDSGRGGYAWLYHPKIEDSIRELVDTVDYVLLLAHGGVENIAFPIKEVRERYRRLCDVGVDVIVGHHPHVPQGHEKYKGALIFYSTGNFYFDTPAYIDKPDDSYSVYLKFDDAGNISFDLVFHRKNQTQLTRIMESESSFSIFELNNLLGDGYEDRCRKACLDLYRKYYYSYYCDSLGAYSPSMGVKGFFKYMLKKVLRRKTLQYKSLLLLHNIRIESHRFAVQQALSAIGESRHE